MIAKCSVGQDEDHTCREPSCDLERPFDYLSSPKGRKQLRSPEAGPAPRREQNGPDIAGFPSNLACCAQVRASASFFSASSSLTPIAKVSSETRI